MNGKILVTYASKYGSTAEIAEKIGEILRGYGLQADVMPVNSFDNLGSYSGVVIGSAVYIGKWQKEAVSFLRANVKGLSERPVWLFSSGPTGKGDPVELVNGDLVPTSLRPAINRIQPKDITVFHGNIDPKKVNAIEGWAIKSLVKKPFGDFRDWALIEKWAGKIAAQLKGEKPA